MILTSAVQYNYKTKITRIILCFSVSGIEKPASIEKEADVEPTDEVVEPQPSVARKRKTTTEKTAPVKKSKPVKSGNKDYNATMVGLVEYLRKKGRQDRYAPKHLDLWTSEIIEGNLAGPDEEPEWENFLDKIDFAPRAGASVARRPSNVDFMQQMMILNEEARRDEKNDQRRRDEERRADERKRDDMFQQTLLLLVGKPGQSHNNPSSSTNARPVLDWDAERVHVFLNENNFSDYSEAFLANGIDGATVTQLDHAALEELGVKSALQRAKLLGQIKKLS